MRAAHQGVTVASLPKSQASGPFLNLFQTASQVSAAPAQPTPVPVPLAPIPSGGSYRPAPARASAPASPSARPEAAAGLDGWLMDRVFGGNR
jgi:penicillin-binding protein 1A